MKCCFVFVILLNYCIVVSSQNVDIQTIDDFSVQTPTLVILIPNNPGFPLVQSTFTQGSSSNIIGGERDLELYIGQGNTNLVVIAGVSGGEFSCATPNGVAGFSLLQYDGTDGSMNLNPYGLGGLDLTQNFATSFHTAIESDIATNITISVYSGSSYSCKRQISLPGGDTMKDYIIDFSSFSGNCDFTYVGAIEVDVEMTNNVDVLISKLSTYGASLSSATPTPTRTPIPTFDPTPSQTRTQTSTPTNGAYEPSSSQTPTPTSDPTSSQTPTCTPHIPSASRTPKPGVQSTCCYYFSSDQQYESSFCQQLGYGCPGVIGFYPAGNHTVSSCSNCYV